MYETFASAWPALGSTVVHFLWQGALIGLIAAIVLGCMRRASSGARYAVASGAMLLCFASFAATFLTIFFGPSGDGILPILLARAGVTAEITSNPNAAPNAATAAAWCWAAGVLCMSLRFGLSGYGAQRLRTVGVSAPDASWERAFQTLKETLGVARTVRLLRSALAEVPMVVGWFSPVVLVPASAFTTLSRDQLKALLAHELAHIRRHDHLLNAAQAVVEIVLFFHPVVWWISKQMRVEREFCCDESSVQVTGDPRLLAEALARMETLRIAAPQMTVLASNGGSLVQRIQRILGVRPDGKRTVFGWHIPVGLALAGIVAVAGTAYAAPTLERGGERTTAGQDDDGGENRRDLAAREKRIRAAVEAGKMTREEAARHLEELRKRMAGARGGEEDGQGGDDDAHLNEAIANYRAMQERLEADVKAGKLTREQADKKLIELRKTIGQRHESKKSTAASQNRLELYMREVEAAVKAGRLTPEEGRKKIEAVQARMEASKMSAERFVDSGSGSRQKSADYEGLKRRIDAGVKAGKITPEQGKARLEAWKKDVQKRQAAGLQPDAEAVKRRIDAAVKAGKITPEQGKARLEAWKKSVAERKAKGSQARTVESVAKELQELVKAGKITQEQADARLAGLKQSLAEREAAGRRR